MKYLYQYLEDIANEEARGILFVNSFGKRKFVSYSEFRNHAIAFLTWLRENGIKKDDYAIIKIFDKELYLTAVWACIYGGIKCICTPLDKTEIDTNLLSISNVYMIVDQSMTMNEKVIKVDYSIFDNTNEEFILKDRHEDDVIIIQYSSGSTSEPKGILLSEKNIITHSLGIEKQYGLSENDSFISWLPLNHNMGLAGFHITPLIFNLTQIQIDTMYFRRDPSIWFKLIDEYQISVTVSNCSTIGMMIKLEKLFSDWNYKLNSLRVIFIAGEKVDIRTMTAFFDKFKKMGLQKNMITPSYGLTESTLTVSAKLENELVTELYVTNEQCTIGDKINITENRNSNIFISVGIPLPHIEIKITDMYGKSLNEKIIGLIKVKSDANAKGYLKIEDNKLNVYNLIDKNGFIDTGDIGFVNKGELFIIGRYKEMISINGKNYFYNDIEEQIKTKFPQYIQNIAVTTIIKKDGGEALGLFVNDESIDKEILSSMIKCVAKNLGINIEICQKMKSFPTTTLGKISRYQIAVNYENEKEYLNSCFNDNFNIDNANDLEKIVIKTIAELLSIDAKSDDYIIDLCKNSMTLTIVLKEVINQIEDLGFQVDKNFCIANISKSPTIKELSIYLLEMIKEN